MRHCGILLCLGFFIVVGCGHRQTREWDPSLVSDRFKFSEEGILTDIQTGMEWYPGPDEDMSWDEAKSWVENLSVGGGNWRLPIPEELRGLYREQMGNRNLDQIFEMKGWWVWSVPVENSNMAILFRFDQGGSEPHERSSSYSIRAFAIRSPRTK